MKRPQNSFFILNSLNELKHKRVMHIIQIMTYDDWWEMNHAILNKDWICKPRAKCPWPISPMLVTGHQDL